MIEHLSEIVDKVELQMFDDSHTMFSKMLVFCINDSRLHTQFSVCCVFGKAGVATMKAESIFQLKQALTDRGTAS